MSRPLQCFYTKCEITPTVTCNCSNSPTFLCVEHSEQHQIDAPESPHQLRSLLEDHKERASSPVIPNEKELGQLTANPQPEAKKTIRPLGGARAIIGNVFKTIHREVQVENANRKANPTLKRNLDEEDLRILKDFKMRQLRTHQLEGERFVAHLISFSSSGELYAAGGLDSQVYVWKATDGQLVNSFKGHTQPVYSVCFAPNDEYLVSGGSDKTIRLWRVADGEPVHIFEGHSDRVYSVVFSGNNELLVSGSDDKTVKLWSVAGELLYSFLGHSGPVFAVSFSHNDRFIASASGDQTIRVWDVSLCELKHTLCSHSDVVRSVCFSRNSSLLVSGSSDKTVKL